MSYTLTFEEYVIEENKEYEYDDYSMNVDVDYTTQE